MTELEKAAQKNGPEVELCEQMQRAQARVRLLKPDDFDAPELDLSDSHTALFALAEYWKGKYDKLKAQALATTEPVQVFLVRDVAALLGASVPDVCKALAHLGHGQRSTNMEITPDEALSVAKLIAAPSERKGEPVAWMLWTHGPVLVFLNKDEAKLEFERLNHTYPEPARKLIPLYTSPQVPEDVQMDAERYRWLRAKENANRDEWNLFGPYSTPAQIDAAIDAARKGE